MDEAQENKSDKKSVTSYDFDKLVEANPQLKQHVHLGKSERQTIDFSDSEAVKELNRALLYTDYNLNQWDIPKGYLCPPVPGRADYINAVANLLQNSLELKSAKNSSITCLDIGAGANCIYPIIGVQKYGWHFIASETDKTAIKNIDWLKSKNIQLNKNLVVREQRNYDNILKNIIDPREIIDCTVCNPPFFASEKDALKANTRKSRNLSGNKKAHSNFNFGGVGKELWYKGGEEAFVTKMIRESKDFATNVFWFTSLVSSEKNIPKIVQALKGIKVLDFKIIDLNTGHKKSRIVAWTFLNKRLQQIWLTNKK